MKFPHVHYVDKEIASLKVDTQMYNVFVPREGRGVEGVMIH